MYLHFRIPLFWNNIYGNGTNSSSHGNFQLQDDNNSLPHDECRLYNDTNSSSQNVLQSYSPDVDVTDLIIRCGFTPLFLLIGLGGNTSTIVVFKRQLKRGPTVMFIISLAFCDLIFLLLRVVAIVYAWFQMFAPETIRYVRPNTLFWIVFSNTFQRAGGWFIIVIIIERLVAVWFPFNLRDISTRKRAKCIITFVITTTLIITIPWDTSILLHSLTEDISCIRPSVDPKRGDEVPTNKECVDGALADRSQSPLRPYAHTHDSSIESLGYRRNTPQRGTEAEQS